MNNIEKISTFVRTLGNQFIKGNKHFEDDVFLSPDVSGDSATVYLTVDSNGKVISRSVNDVAIDIGLTGTVGNYMLRATYDTDNDGIVDRAERIDVAVRNNSGATITNGQIVYLNGATGNRPTIALSKANVESTSSGTFGIVNGTIANNSDGYVTCIGTIHTLDTSEYAEGSQLWLSPTTAGAVTTTKPLAPNHAVFIGIVTRQHPTAGSVVTRIQNGYELDELHNVSASSPSDGQLLRFSSGTNLWQKWTPNYLTSFTETDPVYTGSSWYTTTNNALQWDLAYSWGNHANYGYLTSFTETDPIFGASAAATITTDAITNWNTAYGWGNHATQGYLTSFIESDPTVPEHVKTIVENQITEWDTAYGWGDHKTVGYLTSFTETDPVFAASPANTITTDAISNWNTAYGWGNHAIQGYLTSFTETDPTVPAHVKTISENQIIEWDTAYGWGDHKTFGYLTSYTETDPIYTASSWYTTTNNSTNWNTAYGWGNHASAGYQAASTAITTSNIGSQYVEGANRLGSYTANTSSSFQAWNLYESGTARLNPTADTWYYGMRISHGDAEDYYSATLAISFFNEDLYLRRIQGGTPATWYRFWHNGDFGTGNISNWNTAYGWGNHALAGYLTAETDSQTLEWNQGEKTLSITNGNSVDFAQMASIQDVEAYGFITGESDTLATVTARGATTSVASTFSNTLTVSGDNAILKASSVTADTELPTRRLAEFAGIYNSGSNGHHMFISSTAGNGPWEINQTKTWGGIMTFGVSSDGTEITRHLAINSSGNVGIGTTNPNEKLQVAGNINAYVNGGIDAGLFASTSAGSTTIALRSNGVTHFNGGNVGIGTTSPEAELDVNGRIAIRSSNRLYFGHTTTLNSWTTAQYASGSTHRFNANSFEFTNEGYGSTEYMRITASGNVGIGTSNPQHKLDVAGNISLGDWTKAGATYVGLRRADDGSFGGGGDSGLVIESYNHASPYNGNYSQKVHLRTHLYNGGSHDVITAYGLNVGIGNNSPTAKLQVGPEAHPNATGIEVAAGAGGANLLARDADTHHNWFPYTNGQNYYSADAHNFRSAEHGTAWVTISASDFTWGGNTVATRTWVAEQGYLTSESDTLDSVVTRGNATSVSNVQFNNGVTLRRNVATGQNIHTYVTNSGGGYSSAIYIGANPGADWLIGKDAYGVGNDRFQIGSWNGYAYIDITYNSTAGRINFPNNGGLTVNDNTIWHAGNDGSGSNLDADYLDGYHASSFLRSDAYNSNYGGLQVHRNIGTIDGSWPDTDHTFGLENSDAGNIVINFHRAGYTSNNLWYNGSKFRFDQSLEVQGVVTATGGNSTNWNTAYGWGNHATANYWVTSNTDPQIVAASSVTFQYDVEIQGQLLETSSIRFKENIVDLEPVGDKVSKLRPVRYNKIGTDVQEIGLIAEEVAELFPEVVHYNEDGEAESLNYTRLSVLLLQTVKELSDRIQKLENK